MSNVSTKKRLMYLSGEDFYLYCYSIFVILEVLGCRNGKSFRDHRKLAFLIDIISDTRTVYVISRSTQEKPNSRDFECLIDSYSNGLMRRSEILKLLFVLEKRGYVALVRGKNHEINVTLMKDNFPKTFWEENLFDSESKNISLVSKKVRGLASLTLTTMLRKLYVENGVRTWV